ncbi:MAG TPA: dihydrofolate reductase family protein [Dongiaceae bacterium]|jgi:riboflavin-specific deaminase-like protein|nr:dihydrofolate reductase family protein [Dongiaceae bacterium]
MKKLNEHSTKIREQECARPFVLVNMAMTADGKIATANRAVSSFGSTRDHDHLLELRATADAVMTGARTADLNDINLGPGPARYRKLRRRRGLAEYNLRILVSGSGSINPRAEVFRHKFSPLLILTTRRATPAKLKQLRAVATEVKVCGRTQINFRMALRWLQKKWGVARLLCEGGGELNAALFEAGLVDELHLTVCPKVFGGRNAPTIADGPDGRSLATAATFRLKSKRQIGAELFLVFEKAPTT